MDDEGESRSSGPVGLGLGWLLGHDGCPMSTIERHRTAMSRNFLSRPLQQAHEDGLLQPEDAIFDYGCGRGDDIRTLTGLGFDIAGWDPGHAPDEPLTSAPVVNIGYVVNVIEDPVERSEALAAAWELATKVLIVSARLSWDPDAKNGKPFGDGVVTKTGTFQKYYSQEELREWIAAVTGERPITAAPGIFYVFRDPGAAQSLLARQSRASGQQRLGIAELIYQGKAALLEPLETWVAEHRRLPSPADLGDASDLVEDFGSVRAAFSLICRVTGPSQWSDVDLGTRKRSEQRFEEHLDDLQPLIDFVTDRGRLPRPGELANEADLEAEFGSPRAAFSLIRRVTGPERWEDLEETARNNFLVYVALSAFGGRPKFSELPNDLQYDARDLFGSYSNAVGEGNRLLYSIADLAQLNEACQNSPFGKMTPDALYIHVSGLELLPPVLRVYQGAARALTGNVDDTTIIKLHRLKPQVSFLAYPSFDRDPHPALASSVVARLPELRVSFRNFAESDNPPILHRKETFLPVDHPDVAKYEKLTRQEERAELLSANNIGRRQEWEDTLAAAGKALRGHRLVNRTN